MKTHCLIPIFLILLGCTNLLKAAVITVPGDYTTIQQAINQADAEDIIEVSPGTYNESIDFTGIPLTLRSSSQDPNDTIINGTGNFHVIIFDDDEDNETILDGFTITGGNANGTGEDSKGGGIYILASTPTIQNCVIKNNSADFLGGGFNFEGTGTTIVRNCIFKNNHSNLIAGAMHNNAGAITLVEGCIFTNNTSLADSGAVRNNGPATQPLFKNCKFIGNSAEYGGAMINSNSSTPKLFGCEFSNNSASTNQGGALYLFSNGSAIIFNCFFENNSSQSGGAIYGTDVPSTMKIYHSHFLNNSAVIGGAIHLTASSNPTVVNCLISNNSATDNGGGIYIDCQSDPSVINSTIVNNTAGINGGGVFSTCLLTKSTFNNCIFWSNADSGGMDTSAQFYVDITANPPTINHSNVMGGWTGVGLGNINADPLFVDPDGLDNTPGTIDDQWQLQAGSPCIDRGDTTVLPPDVFSDFSGAIRVIDDPDSVNFGVAYFENIVDMGLYEFQPGPCKPNLEGDINCDNIVNLLDFSILAANWLTNI